MNTNKSLIVRKNNIFIKIRNFLKQLFKTEDTQETNRIKETIQANDERTNFLNSMRGEQDNPETIILQKAYEKNEINPEDMSYAQILALNKLYKKQISKIDEDLNMKKIQVNILEKKMAN